MSNFSSKSPAQPQATLPGLFEHVLVERRPSYSREEWNKVRLVCTEMRHVPTGRTPNPEELREAAAAATEILILHFPEGPRGAEKAQKAFSRWLDNLGAEPRPAAARWRAAMREIASLEQDPAQPNYLTHIDAIKGVDFSGVGRGPNLRSRQTAHEQAKIWSALSWRKTPDGSYPSFQKQSDHGAPCPKCGRTIRRWVAQRHRKAVSMLRLWLLPRLISERVGKAKPFWSDGRWAYRNASFGGAADGAAMRGWNGNLRRGLH